MSIKREVLLLIKLPVVSFWLMMRTMMSTIQRTIGNGLTVTLLKNLDILAATQAMDFMMIVLPIWVVLLWIMLSLTMVLMMRNHSILSPPNSPI